MSMKNKRTCRILELGRNEARRHEVAYARPERVRSDYKGIWLASIWLMMQDVMRPAMLRKQLTIR